jgi:integrase family protein with SAM-like domain
MDGVYRPTRKLPDGRRVPYKSYRIAYRDAAGRRKTEKAYTSYALSLALWKRRLREVARQRAGRPVRDRRRRRSLAQLTAYYVNELRMQGRSPRHATEQERYLTTTWSSYQVQTLDDLTRADLIHFLGELRRAGRSARTVAAYRNALRGFFTYLVREHWLEANPL